MFFPLQNGSNMIRIDNTQDVYSLQIMLNLIALNEDLIKRNLKAEHRAMLQWVLILTLSFEICKIIFSEFVILG